MYYATDLCMLYIYIYTHTARYCMYYMYHMYDATIYICHGYYTCHRYAICYGFNIIDMSLSNLKELMILYTIYKLNTMY